MSDKARREPRTTRGSQGPSGSRTRQPRSRGLPEPRRTRAKTPGPVRGTRPALFVLLLALGSCSTQPERTLPRLSSPETPQTSASVRPRIDPAKRARNLEERLFDETNRQRARGRLAAQRRSESLDELAREHARQLARRGQGIDHRGFESRFERARERGLAALSENVALNCSNENDPRQLAHEIVDGWMNSRGHRRNLLGTYELTGIGVGIQGSCRYAVQLYGQGSSRSP